MVWALEPFTIQLSCLSWIEGHLKHIRPFCFSHTFLSSFTWTNCTHILSKNKTHHIKFLDFWECVILKLILTVISWNNLTCLKNFNTTFAQLYYQCNFSQKVTFFFKNESALFSSVPLYFYPISFLQCMWWPIRFMTKRHWLNINHIGVGTKERKSCKLNKKEQNKITFCIIFGNEM